MCLWTCWAPENAQKVEHRQSKDKRVHLALYIFVKMNK